MAEWVYERPQIQIEDTHRSQVQIPLGETIYVMERNSNFGIEVCFALNCTLKYCRISHEIKCTLRVKNCLYLDVELFFKLMTKWKRSAIQLLPICLAMIVVIGL